jgi:hypothetical protein
MLGHIGIVACSAEGAALCYFRRLGLLGTRWLVDGGVYPETLAARGLEWRRPSSAAHRTTKPSTLPSSPLSMRRRMSFTRLKPAVTCKRGGPVVSTDAVRIRSAELRQSGAFPRRSLA